MQSLSQFFCKAKISCGPAALIWVSILLLLSSVLAAYDDLKGVAALEFLSPFAYLLISVAEIFVQNPSSTWIGIITLAVLALASALLVSLKKRLFEATRATVILGALIGGQLCFVFEHLYAGAMLYVFALLASFCSPDPEKTSPNASETPNSQAFGRLDFYLLAFVSLLAVFFRFYLLNRIHPVFEGELAPYALGALSLRSMPLANAGMHGPWAPLGILYYIPIYLAAQIAGPTLLTIRLGSAIVSVATVALTYMFLRRVSGSIAAFIGAVFMSLESLQIGWGRTDVHPHGSTTWPSLLICLCTYIFLKERKSVPLFFLAALMGLSWHQYPSGQTAFLIPVFALFASCCAERAIRRDHILLLVAVIVGSALWISSGLLLDYLATGHMDFCLYFKQLGPRMYSNTLQEASLLFSLLQTLSMAFKHLGDLGLGLYTQAPYLFHQDILIPISGIPTRTISWLGIVLATFFALRALKHAGRSDVIVLGAWMIAAILPALFSDHAYPKRAATLYPALYCMAALGAADFFEILKRNRLVFLRSLFLILICIGFAGWSAFISWQWFSGEKIKPGIPGEVIFSQELVSTLQPRTIIVFKAYDHSFQGKFAYLLSDFLYTIQPVIWYNYRTENGAFSEFVTKPENSLDFVQKAPFYYLWSSLYKTLPVIAEEKNWEHVVYILQEGPSNEEDSALIKAQYPQAQESRFAAQNCNACGFIRLDAKLED